MFRPYMWVIFRLCFDLQSSYTRCVGCSLRVLGVTSSRFSILGIMTKGCYKWIVISCLYTHVIVGFYSYATDAETHYDMCI